MELGQKMRAGCLKNDGFEETRIKYMILIMFDIIILGGNVVKFQQTRKVPPLLYHVWTSYFWWTLFCVLQERPSEQSPPEKVV